MPQLSDPETGPEGPGIWGRMFLWPLRDAASFNRFRYLWVAANFALAGLAYLMFRSEQALAGGGAVGLFAGLCWLIGLQAWRFTQWNRTRKRNRDYRGRHATPDP